MTQVQNPPSHKATAGRQIRKLTPPEAETDVPLSRVRSLDSARDLHYCFGLRIWSKIRAILGWLKFVSAYVERDKKILKNFIFVTTDTYGTSLHRLHRKV